MWNCDFAACVAGTKNLTISMTEAEHLRARLARAYLGCTWAELLTFGIDHLVLAETVPADLKRPGA